MRRDFRFFALCSLVCVATPLVARAQVTRPEPGFTPSEIWFRTITTHGFAEGSYGYNFNRPDSDKNSLRVFDFDDNEFKLDVFEIVAEREISKRGQIGFRLDAEYGQSIPEVTAARGLFRELSTGKAEDYDLQQAYVSWIAPIGDGLRIDAGKFVKPFGYEVIDGYDGYNDNQTRSFLFGFAAPFTHTGLRARYTFAPQLCMSVMAVQGWDNVHDNNDGRSFGAQLAFKPVPDWAITLTVMGGPEQKNDEGDDRMLYGLTSTLKATKEFTLGVEALYGEEEGLQPGGAAAQWSGAAGYLRYDFDKHASLALRAETFDDTDGTRTGTAQTLTSVTITPQYKFNDQLILRGDLRQDYSDEDVFEEQSGLADDQLTISVSLLLVI